MVVPAGARGRPAAAPPAPALLTLERCRRRRGFHVDLDADFYFHTQALLAGPAAGSGGGFQLGLVAQLSHLHFRYCPLHFPRCCKCTRLRMLSPRSAPLVATGGDEPALCAVVEVVLAERSEEGVVVGEYSAGWAQAPLEAPAAAALRRQVGRSGLQPDPGCAAEPHCTKHKLQPADAEACGVSARATAAQGSSALPGSPLRSPQRRGASLGSFSLGSPTLGAPTRQPGGGCSVAVYAGSPRYLLLRAAMPEHAYPPQPLVADGAECRLHYMVGAQGGGLAFLVACWG